MNEKQIKPVWPAFRKGKETFMKTRKLWSAKAAKWLFVIGLLLFTEFFSTVAEAAVPYPLKKLPIMAYPRQRMVTIYADAALSKQPVTMSGDFLKFRYYTDNVNFNLAFTEGCKLFLLLPELRPVQPEPCRLSRQPVREAARFLLSER